MDYGLGIDLGTTFSAAAISTADTVEVFFLGARSATIPSALAAADRWRTRGGAPRTDSATREACDLGARLSESHLASLRTPSSPHVH